MKKYVNSYQSPEERRNKYTFLLEKGATPIQARRFRDWTMGCIKRIVLPQLKNAA